jgi:hypothetical protein
MLNPLWLLILLLLTVALAATATYARRERLDFIGAAGVLVVLLLLVAGRSFAEPVGSAGFPWAWAIGEQNWWPAVAFALLALVALLMARGRSSRGETSLLLLLLTAGLSAVWADSAAALVTTWTVLGLAMWLAAPSGNDGATSSRRRLFWLAPLFLWLGAASVPVAAGAQGLDAQLAPLLAQSMWILAASVGVGTFPLHFWRSSRLARYTSVNALTHMAPAAAGAVLLASLAGGTAATTYALPLTLAGLLGLLWAAYQAWSQRQRPVALATALILGEASLLVLLAVWGGQEAFLAETRVLLLAGGALLLAAGSEEQGAWQQLALIPAVAALAAFPLTAGFAGRGALYTAWLASDQWLLVAVTVLLHVPLLAAALALVWPRRWPPGPVTLRAATLLLPALGLVSWQTMGAVVPLAWGVIALQIVGALVLFRYASEAQGIEQVLQQAVALNLESRALTAALKDGVRTIGNALRDATRMLEGEAGPLWVLFFLVVIWLAR